MKRLFLTLAIVLSTSFVFAEGKEGVDITIYNQNFGLVKDRRMLNLREGINHIRFSDVAAEIEPTSVHFKSLTDPLGCTIQEQNYEYDLLNSDKLLKKYVDKKIKLIAKGDKVYEGTLMSYDGENIVISVNGSLSMICRKDNIKEISFPDLPEGLITKPTLMWQIANDKAANQLTEVSYLTNGINWNADYVAVVDKDDKNIDLSGWVTIDNRSGATYKDANLKLIAGDVHRVKDEGERPRYGQMKMMEGASASQFEEKAFFEYHMYTLQRKATVKDNQTKQISLLSANNVPIKKLFIYDPVDYFGRHWYYYNDNQSTKEQKIRVKVELKNSKENNLGMPLPKGKIKVYKKDTDESLQFVGEDAIDHTPKDEKVRLYLGDAFDLVGERKCANFKEGGILGRSAEESYEISLRNHKEEDVEIIVVEHLWRYSNWKIIEKSHEFTKKDAQTVEFKVPVPKNGETKITYTVKYWW